MKVQNRDKLPTIHELFNQQKTHGSFDGFLYYSNLMLVKITDETPLGDPGKNSDRKTITGKIVGKHEKEDLFWVRFTSSDFDTADPS